MLVLAREVGQSIHIGSAAETCLVTVLKLLPQRRAIAVLAKRMPTAEPGEAESRSVEMAMDTRIQVSETAEIMLVDLGQGKARIAVEAPKENSVHRLEVYEAIQRQSRWQGPGPEDGTAGSPVPRPSSPMPPSLRA